MESLKWVDTRYKDKHHHEDKSNLRPMYYANLKEYHDSAAHRKSPMEGFLVFLERYGRKAVLSLTVLLLSYTPLVGQFVMPAISFYYFRTAVGPKPAIAIFASGVVLPKRYLVRFLQTYFSSRTLMRELVSTRARTKVLALTWSSAPTLLPACSLSARAETQVVSRPRGSTLWLWCRVLHYDQDPSSRRVGLWYC